MPSSTPRVVVSYARADGESIADNICDDLKNAGISHWRDREGMRGGDAWWVQIKQAINDAETLVLVVTPGALSSRAVTQEWSFARQRGVRVFPVLAAPGSSLEELPRWMSASHFYDLKNEAQRQRFLNDLNTTPERRQYLSMSERLPADFVSRPKELKRLVRLLLKERRRRHQPTISALFGPGGYGKTTLASAVCQNPAIQDTYYGGILWITFGQAPQDLVIRVAAIAQRLGSKLQGFGDLQSAVLELTQLLEGSPTLLVLDDLWEQSQLAPFLAVRPPCALLITTRIGLILPPDANHIDVGSMQRDQAITLLRSGLPKGSVGEIGVLAGKLRRWPILLRLANAVLRRRVTRYGESFPNALSFVSQSLARRGITAFDAKKPYDRNSAVARTLALSLDQLAPEERDRFRELAIFPQDVGIPISDLAKYWKATGGLDAHQVEELLDHLFQLSLLRRLDLSERVIQLHDVILEFLQVEEKSRLRHWNARFLDSFGRKSWTEMRSDEHYLWRHLSHHLVQAGRRSELERLLSNFEWVRAKLLAADITSLITDYAHFAHHRDLKKIRQALCLSSHVLDHDKDQLPAQLLGRIKIEDRSKLSAGFLKQVRRFKAKAWLRPLFPSLTGPGGSLVRTIFPNDGPLTAVAAVPNRLQVVLGSYKGPVRVFDIDSGIECGIFPNYGRAGCVRVDGEGRVFASASRDLLHIRRLESAQTLWKLNVHPHWITSFAFLPVAQHKLAAGLDNGRVMILDRLRRKCVNSFQAHQSAITSIAIDSGGSRLITGAADGSLKVWILDALGATETGVLNGHSDQVNSIDISGDGRIAISASNDATIKVWDLCAGKETSTLTGHGSAVTKAALLPDGNRILSSSQDTSVVLWDLKTQNAVSTIGAHSNSVEDLAITFDGRFAATVSADHTLKVWNLGGAGKASRRHAPNSRLTVATISPDARRVITGSFDRKIRIFDLRTKKSLEIECHKVWPTCLAVTHDCFQLISGAYDGSLYLSDIATGKVIFNLSGHKGVVTSIAITRDGTRAASADSDGLILVWDLRNGTPVRSTAYPIRIPCVIAMTPDEKNIVSGSEDGKLSLWDLKTGREERSQRGHLGKVGAIGITPDGRRVLSVSIDQTLKSWDLDGLHEIASIDCAVGHGSDILITKEGKHAIFSSDDTTMSVVDLQSGAPIANFSVDSYLRNIAFLKNRETIFAGESSGAVHLLRLIS